MNAPSRSLPWVLLLVTLGLLTSVGSGGGGGGGGDGEELEYVGSTSPTIITAANATRLTAHIFGSAELGNELPTAAAVPAATSSHSPGLLPLVRALQVLPRPMSRLAGAIATSPVALAIDEREQCAISGYATLTGSIDDASGTGTLAMTYYDCEDTDIFYDGAVTWRVNAADYVPNEYWVPIDSTFTFKKISVRTVDFDIVLGGTLRDQLNSSDGSETLTLDIVLKDNLTQRMQKTENAVIVAAYAEGYFISQTISGRFYDSIDGYLDVTTAQALLYAQYDSMFPASGRLRMTGADSARLRVTAVSETMALVELDLNNDTVYETTGEIPWEVIYVAGSDPQDGDGDGLPDAWEDGYGLSNDTYADASEDGDEDTLSNYDEYVLGTDPTSADSDNDGMPDGWEVTYGFNPLSSTDAALDLDGDEATNLQEYTYGTNPTDDTSTPADLAVSKSVSIATVSAQTLFEYTLSITNQGPGTARGVSLTDTLPEGAAIYAPAGYLPTSPWDCSIDNVNGTLTCVPFVPSQGLMAAGEEVTIVVPVIAPATAGSITNSASIESTTLDYVAGNDAATVDNTVAGAVLTQIDVAVDGLDGVDGLERPFRLAISPDAKHIYVPAIVADAVVVFARDVDGTLTFVEAQRDGLDTPDGETPNPDFPKAVAISPDGNSVYVTTEWDSKIIVYSRDSTTGALTYVETHQNGVDGVSGIGLGIAATVSADGGNVYVAGPGDNAVAVFNRDTSTGALTFGTAIVDGVGGVDGLGGAFDVALSPDDAYLYVAGMLDDAIAVFSRDPDSGALTYIGQFENAGSPLSLAISSDGEHLYATGSGLAAFARDAGSGALTRIAAYGNGQDGVVGLEGMYGVAIAPDGDYVYVAAQYDGSVGAFARDTDTGALRFIEVQKDGVGGIDGLGVAWALVVSPDSAFVYVSAGVEPDSAVSAFSVDLAAER